MKIMESYRLVITPLSPIHIGAADSYEPTNYVIDDGVLYEFDTSTTLNVLSKEDKKTLLDISNKRPDADMIRNIQRFFFERRKILMLHAVNRIPVLPGVANLYAARIGQTANIESGGKQVLNRLEIDRTCFDSTTRQPILYGSSIKGAIRTALLDRINNHAKLKKVQDHRTGEMRDENNMELQQRLFKYRAGKFELDPMRLVQLSDAIWSGNGFHAAQVYMAVNRKKDAVKDKSGNLRKSQAESRDLYQILECVAPWRYRTFIGQLNIQAITGLDEKHRVNIPAEDLRFSIKDIAQACNKFYKPILEHENRLMRERGYIDTAWDKCIQDLMRLSSEKMDRGDVFLLRVGRHSGAESVTLNGVRRIRIMKGKGVPADERNQAGTLWLAANNKDQTQKLLPFGWILVEIHPPAGQPKDWPELKSICEPYHAAVRTVVAKIENKRAEIEKIRAAAEAKRREEAEKARLRAEEEAQIQQANEARQARLAAMSPNFRRIEEFKIAYAARAAQLRGGKDRANTEYHDRARKLAKDALEGADWTAEEKRAVADAITEWLPKVVHGIDKKELKKLNLDKLRLDS